MNSFVTFFAIAACFVSAAYAHVHGSSSAVYQQNFVKKFGQKEVNWKLAPLLTKEQRAEICSSIHELTGHGPAKMKETKIQDAYIKFDSKRYPPMLTQVLMCKQDNEKEHTYYATQGLYKGSVTLIHPNGKQMDGKDVFHFTWSVDQVRKVPALIKVNGA